MARGYRGGMPGGGGMGGMNMNMIKQMSWDRRRPEQE